MTEMGQFKIEFWKDAEGNKIPVIEVKQGIIACLLRRPVHITWDGLCELMDGKIHTYTNTEGTGSLLKRAKAKIKAGLRA